MADNNGFDNALDIPARGGASVTPSNTVDLAKFSRAIYAGVSGDLSVVMIDGSELTFTNFPAGSPIPIRVRRVKATGTTATGIISIY